VIDFSGKSRYNYFNLRGIQTAGFFVPGGIKAVNIRRSLLVLGRVIDTKTTGTGRNG
jgi:hypothetical protein